MVICACRVPDVVIAQAWANMWFRTDNGEEACEPDPWVLRMIHEADSGMLD